MPVCITGVLGGGVRVCVCTHIMCIHVCKCIIILFNMGCVHAI